MVTVIAEVKVKEGMIEEAIKVLRESVPKILAGEKGTKVYIPHIVKGKGNENLILFYEKYENDEALKLHSSKLGKSLAKLLPLLEPGMNMKTCEELL
jgi:quinol monooxygenase YgiN